MTVKLASDIVESKRVIDLKKIVLILALIMLLTPVASAEVARGIDSFTGGTRVGSYSNVKDAVDSISLVKIISPGLVEYEISAGKRSTKEFLLSKTFIDIKIDNYTSHSIEIKKVELIPTDSPFVHSSYVDAPISNEIVDEIKTAKRVALRFQTANGHSLVLVLPDTVLAEWKEVINTEK